MSPPQERPSRRPRADATRNRERLQRAASEVFSEVGIEATVSQVAARADVGNATVYRNFATKSDLLAVVTTRWLDDLRAALRQRPTSDAPGAFRTLLHDLFARLRDDRLALDLLRLRPDDDRAIQARAEVQALVTRELDAAIASGDVRPEITYADLSVLVLGMSTRLSEVGETDPRTWTRYAGLAWQAIATPAARG